MTDVQSAREWYFKKVIEETSIALSRNNFTPVYARSKKDALKEIMARIPAGATVTHGGSLTIEELGLSEKLSRGDYAYLRGEKSSGADIDAIRRKAFHADVYLTSVNAITKDGLLVAIDGFGNRVAAIMYGPKRVIVVAGKNKIVAGLDDAFKRIREWAAPLHARRRNSNLPCTKAGKCVDCKTERRICNKVSIVQYERVKDRITVILVGEDLGL